VGRRSLCYDARALQRSFSRLFVFGLAMECGFVALLAAKPGPGHAAPFLVLFFAVFLVYLLAVRDTLRETCDTAGRLVLGLACLFRLTFVAAPPALGNDLYRYLWDGRVTLSGGNPYLEPPASRVAAFQDDPDTARVEHAEIPTIYPPGAQALFAAGALLHAGVLGIKLLVVGADLLVIVVLRALLRARDRPPVLSLIYAWNPLAVTETAWSGHLEPAAILFVLLAARAIIQKRDGRATLALTLGGLVKLFPLVLLAPLLRSIRARCLVIVPIVFAAAYWPFRSAGRHLFAGLRQYADRWLANESLFAIVHAGIDRLGPTARLKGAITWVLQNVPHTGGLGILYAYVYPVDLAKGACALALGAFAFVLWRRRVDPLRGCFLLTAAVLLLSPTVHPWYVLWILPWLCLFPSRAFILLTGLVSLAYVNLGSSGRAFEPYPWIRVGEYAPFYVLLVADWLRQMRAARVAVPPTG
jgi:glycosyl transferase family 87